MLKKYLTFCCVGLAALIPVTKSAAETDFGPLYDSFHLTLTPGDRTEITSPLFYSEHRDTTHQWAIPLLSHTEDSSIGYEELDFAYPLLTYDRFGEEYRWQFFQFFSWAGGRNQDESSTHRFTIFPLYFQQRSTDPAQDYTAVVPFYGHLNHRLFKDDIYFVMFPGYAKTRKKDVITYNMPYPFFHLRYGDGLHGWQAWPIVGKEHKDLTTTTNIYGDPVTVGGHDNLFILWPFFNRSYMDTGTDHPSQVEGSLFFYSSYHSKTRDSLSIPWPIGVTHTIDREKKYEEWDTPWPLMEFAKGEGKNEQRIWPFYNQAHNKYMFDKWYCWPIYKYHRVISPPLDRERTRILFFLYSSVNEKNTETGKTLHRGDLWPFYTRRHEYNGNERLQVLAIIEPFLPNNKSIERDYSFLYSLWRAEKNPKAGMASQSLLWNLYRKDVTPGTKKISLLFGLFQYQSMPEGSNWRICYIPGHKAKASAAPVPPAH